MKEQEPLKSDENRADLTQLLARGAPTDPPTANRLFEVVYDELHRLARKRLANERVNHTLQPTALVHEAYLRLVDQTRVDWRGRTHFFAIGASIMRRILIDHARKHNRKKRGGGWARVTLDDRVAIARQTDFEADALRNALEKLGELDPRQARIVELRFFGGLTVSEVAEVLKVSKRTVEGDWTHAKAWLRRELGEGAEE